MRKDIMNNIKEEVKAFGEFAIGFLEFFGEVICDTFSKNDGYKPGYDLNSGVSYVPQEDNNYTRTYEYWKSLDYNEQEYYFKNNYDLQKNVPDWKYYPNDRELTAKHIAEYAEKVGKDFTCMYDRF